MQRFLSTHDKAVLATGGGLVTSPDAFRLLLERTRTVWLKARPAEHWARVVTQGDLRPMAGHAEAMEDLRNILTARESLYGKADAVVDTSGCPVEMSFAALQKAIAAG